MTEPTLALQPAVFLDRDGVINQDHGYVSRPEAFAFIPGVFEACQRFQAQGYRLVVVTNQSGIARGYYTEADFAALTAWMVQRFAEHGVALAGVYFCPHHPQQGLAPYVQRCGCRKPAPGLLWQAIAAHAIDPARSVMVGDKGADMQAAAAAGVAQRILVRSGQPFADDEAALATAVWPDLWAFAQSHAGPPPAT